MLFAQTRHYALLGWDTYPIILTSKIESLGDLLGTFTEELMDGRYTGHFYRPLLNATFALDYALWGLEPVGYHLTGIVLFAVSAGAFYLLCRRSLGSSATLGPLAALAYFLLQPWHFEVLPVPARRGELLIILLMALALATQLAPRALARGGWPPLLPAVFTLLAVAAKETAVILPLLIFATVLLYTPQPRLAARARRALLAVIPHVVGVSIVLAARLVAVGGLGGHEQALMDAGLQRLREAFGGMAWLLLLPQPAMQASFVAKGLVVGLGVVLLLGVAMGVAWPQQKRHENDPQPRCAAAAVLAGCWLLAVGLMYAAAGRSESWYLTLPGAGMALLVGALVERLARDLRGGSAMRRLVGGAALVLLLVVVGWHARYSAVFCRYQEWDRATSASRQFLDKLREGIALAGPHTLVIAPPLPMWAEPSRRGPRIRGGSTLTDYSVQAWAELVFPDRRIRVEFARPGSGQRPAPDEVLVLITSRVPWF